jgi:N-acetylglucosamine-6-phosphate deacetylase
LILEGIHFATEKGLRLHIRDGRIERMESVEPQPNWAHIAPGFVDIQVNGYGGQDFNDPALTVEKVRQIILPMDQDGLTASCPTLTTHCFELMHHAIETIARACDDDREIACRVAGVHVEGPYLSNEDGPRGAHPREHCRAPDWEEFQKWQEASGGRIVILTLAPEHDGTVPFIRKVVDSGVVVSIGHTAASADQIRAAVDAGASMSTHLGNGAHGQIRRHPNYIWEQLAEDRLVASLIVDGHHLPPSVVKSFIRGKQASRCVVVSDITGLGGMPPGRYQTQALGDVEVLDDGRLVVAGQRQFLAGAALPIPVAIANLIRFASVSLDEAIQMASIRPSQIVGFSVTRLEVGCNANLIRFDLPDLQANEPITIRENVIAGQRVYYRD